MNMQVQKISTLLASSSNGLQKGVGSVPEREQGKLLAAERHEDAFELYGDVDTTAEISSLTREDLDLILLMLGSNRVSPQLYNEITDRVHMERINALLTSKAG